MDAPSPFADYKNNQFLNLETFRKNGQGVPTPVWFMVDGPVIYVRTGARSGKVKRIRNNGRVRVVPCTRMGQPLGEWQEASARLATDPATIEQASHLAGKKYGLIKKMMDFTNRLQKNEWATIVIEKE